MKGLLKYLAGIGLIVAQNVYAHPYSYGNVEVYDEGNSYCCYSRPFQGLYVAIDAGYSWYDFYLHRPALPNLFPLNEAKRELNEFIPVLAIGYDLYPGHKFPARFELNFTYGDVTFTSDPLFLPPFGLGFFANDSFRIRNLMATLYLDFHTCTRFVPFIGASIGEANVTTHHEPQIHGSPAIRHTFSEGQHPVSYGGTIGTRFFFSDHVFANLQLRFTDLKKLNFVTHEISPLGNLDYLSNYFHETTLLLGIAYEF